MVNILFFGRGSFKEKNLLILLVLYMRYIRI